MAAVVAVGHRIGDDLVFHVFAAGDLEFEVRGLEIAVILLSLAGRRAGTGIGTLSLHLEDVVEEPFLARTGLSGVEQQHDLVVLAVGQAAVGEIIGQRFPAVGRDRYHIGNFLCIDAVALELEEYLAADLGRADLHGEFGSVFREVERCGQLFAVDKLPLAASGDHLTVMVARIAALLVGVLDDAVFERVVGLESEVRGLEVAYDDILLAGVGTRPGFYGFIPHQWFVVAAGAHSQRHGREEHKTVFKNVHGG